MSLASNAVTTPSQQSALPVRMCAGMLITDPAGRWLLVKPADPAREPWWGIPGGLVDPREGPRRAAEREVLEEIGLPIAATRLLVVDHLTPIPGERTEAMHFIFDGSTLSAQDGDRIRLDRSELSLHGWVDSVKAQKWLPPFLALRMVCAAGARRLQTTLYLEDGHLTL